MMEADLAAKEGGQASDDKVNNPQKHSVDRLAVVRCVIDDTNRGV